MYIQKTEALTLRPLMTQTLGILGIGAVLLSVAGCATTSAPGNGDEGSDVCQAKEHVPCVGANQCAGDQFCNASGTAWGKCVCSNPGGGSSAGGTSGAIGGASGTTPTSGGTSGEADAGGAGGEGAYGNVGASAGGAGGAGGSSMGGRSAPEAILQGTGGTGGVAGMGGAPSGGGTAGLGGVAGTGGQGTGGVDPAIYKAISVYVRGTTVVPGQKTLLTVRIVVNGPLDLFGYTIKYWFTNDPGYDLVGLHNLSNVLNPENRNITLYNIDNEFGDRGFYETRMYTKLPAAPSFEAELTYEYVPMPLPGVTDPPPIVLANDWSFEVDAPVNGWKKTDCITIYAPPPGFTNDIMAPTGPLVYGREPPLDWNVNSRK